MAGQSASIPTKNGDADSADATPVRGLKSETRTVKAVKREDVMRNDLTFHVSCITPVANSANIAADIFSQSQTTLVQRQASQRRYR